MAEWIQALSQNNSRSSSNMSRNTQIITTSTVVPPQPTSGASSIHSMLQTVFPENFPGYSTESSGKAPAI